MQQQDIGCLTNEKIVEFINQLFAENVKNYIAIASALAVLESRGYDVKSLRIQGAKFLILMAKGLLSPLAYSAFQSAGYVMQKIIKLSLPDQEKLSQTGSVAVYEKGTPNDHRLIPVLKLGRRQADMVFGPHEVRNVEEQRLWYLEKQTELDTAPQRREKKWRYNPKTDVVVYGGHESPLATLRAFVKKNRHLFDV